MTRGRLTIYESAMGGGKSSYLINEVKKAELANYKNFVFVHNFNHKKDCLVSRLKNGKPKEDDEVDGLQIPARTVSNSKEIADVVKSQMSIISDIGVRQGFDVGNYRINVFIDEMQFFDDGLYRFVEFCQQVGIDVYGSGLAFNYRGDPFKLNSGDGEFSFPELIMIADKVIHLDSRCQQVKGLGQKCGNWADRTQRFRDEAHTQPSHYTDNLIESNAKLYVASCKDCLVVPGKFDEYK